MRFVLILFLIMVHTLVKGTVESRCCATSAQGKRKTPEEAERTFRILRPRALVSLRLNQVNQVRSIYRLFNIDCSVSWLNIHLFVKYTFVWHWLAHSLSKIYTFGQYKHDINMILEHNANMIFVSGTSQCTFPSASRT